MVAIDLGTTYSGFAILKKGQIITGKWKIGSEEALESLKTPTALLLQPDEEPKFGYEAEKTFKELTEEGTDVNCIFFNKFKMCLHRRKVMLLSIFLLLNNFREGIGLVKKNQMSVAVILLC